MAPVAPVRAAGGPKGVRGSQAVQQEEKDAQVLLKVVVGKRDLIGEGSSRTGL